MPLRLGDLREWAAVLRGAALARPPEPALGEPSGDGPADSALDAYLAKAGVVAAAASWLYSELLPRVATGPSGTVLGRAADRVAEARDAAATLPLPGAVALAGMVQMLALLVAAFAALLWLAGRRPVPWRVAFGGALAVYVCFALWRAVLGWFGLKVVGLAGQDGAATIWSFVLSVLGAALVLLVAVLPAVALARALRHVAPALHRPIAAGVAAWACVVAADAAMTLSGAEAALWRLAGIPRM